MAIERRKTCQVSLSFSFFCLRRHLLSVIKKIENTFLPFPFQSNFRLLISSLWVMVQR